MTARGSGSQSILAQGECQLSICTARLTPTRQLVSPPHLRRVAVGFGACQSQACFCPSSCQGDSRLGV